MDNAPAEILIAARKAVSETQMSGVVELPPHLLHIGMMYQRTRSLLKAVLLLVREGLSEEASILARSLFTESLQLQSLAAADDTGRWSFVLNHVNRSLVRQQTLLALCPEDEVDFREMMRARLEQEQLKVQRVQRERNVKKLTPFGDERSMAATHGRVDDLFAFEFSQDMVHGSVLAGQSKLKPVDMDGETVVTMDTTTAHEKLTLGVAQFAAASALIAARAAAEIFGWSLDSVEAAEVRITEIVASQEAS